MTGWGNLIWNICSAWELDFKVKEELRDLQSDHTLNMRFTDLPLDKFWISVK
jgi:hypothetical protein